MARQEQDSMAHPAGVGPNAQFAPGMSPQGSQGGGGPSADLQRSKSIPFSRTAVSSNADLGRGSPTPGGMQLDPSQVPPNLRAQMMQQMAPNGQVRPPSSHPMGAMTPQQMEMMRQNGVQMPNGQFPPGQGQMMAAQQGPGGPQGQPMGTPRQQNNNMPPPPAPPANAGGTGPSSPSQQPAPPTPNQNSKAKAPTKKEAAKKVSIACDEANPISTNTSQGAANKKGGNTGATPASEAEQPPTPTPPTPATPMHANSFATKQNAQIPNGAPAPAPNAQVNNPVRIPMVEKLASFLDSRLSLRCYTVAPCRFVDLGYALTLNFRHNRILHNRTRHPYNRRHQATTCRSAISLWTKAISVRICYARPPTRFVYVGYALIVSTFQAIWA